MTHSESSNRTDMLGTNLDAAALEIKKLSAPHCPPISDTTLNHASEDFNFLLEITPTYIAQFNFAETLNCQMTQEQFLDSFWWSSSKCVRISSSYARHLGYSNANDLINQPIGTILPFNSGNQQLISSWYQSGFLAKPIRHTITTANGQNICFEYFFHHQLHAGKIKKLWIVARDITAQLNNITNLQNAERHYRTLVEGPGVILTRTTSTGQLLYISPQIENLIGYSCKALTDNHELIARLVHPEDRSNYMTLVHARFSKKNKISDAEYRIRYKDGTYHWIYERQHPRINQDEQIEYYDSVIIDIHEKKQLEQKLLHSQRVETLGLSVSGIAHDFNNYLAAISGQVELAVDLLNKDNSFNATSSLTHLHLAQQALLNCSAMSKRLLSFSNKTPTDYETVNTHDLLAETANLLRYSLPANISVKIVVDSTISAIWGNKVELQQVLVNLGINARDAIKDTGQILLSAENRDNIIRISVCDNGSGIPVHQLPHIFDPYFTTKASSGGTGLGLNTVYSIIKAHNGQIAVNSIVNEGTQILIDLPVSNKPAIELMSDKPNQSILGSETVLVVEDDNLILAMIRSALQTHGYRVICAQSAEAASRIFATQHNLIDMVFLDYSMQGVSGDLVIQEISKFAQNFPILLTSGYGENIFSVPAEAKCVDFIAKPYPIQELLLTIRSLLERNRKLLSQSQS